MTVLVVTAFLVGGSAIGVLIARPLHDLHLPDGRLFSQAMLAAGHAQPY